MSQEERRLEQTLALHCAPALAGLKPADLISWRPPQGAGEALLRRYVRRFARRGICLRPLCRRGERQLLLVWRPPRLEDWLAREEIAAMLRKEGYPVSDGVEAMLTHLGARLAGEEFPHEVGLFLGYPAADVEGFRRNGGRNCKLCGHWKVYGQVEEAQRRFLAFDRCREALCRWVAEGRSLEQLFPAV